MRFNCSIIYKEISISNDLYGNDTISAFEIATGFLVNKLLAIKEMKFQT